MAYQDYYTRVIITKEDLMKKRTGLVLGIFISVITLLTICISILTVASSSPKAYKTMPDGTPIRWCSGPIPVFLEEDAWAMEKDLEDIMDIYEPYTIKMIYIGKVPEGMQFQNAITVGIEDLPSNTNEAGFEIATWDKRDGCLLSSKIGLYPDIKGFAAYLTLCHEFGHVMGLEHSPDPWSPMHSPAGGLTCRLGDHETVALSLLYGRN